MCIRDSTKSTASQYGYSYKAYLNVVYGSGMTPDIYESSVKDQLLVSKYAAAYSETLTFTDEEIQAYYDEHKNEYDLVDGEYVSISGSPETKTDDEGNTIEMTDEEKAAALEEEKAAVKEQAEALQARLEAGEDPEALAEEFSDSLYSSEVALEQMGSTVNSEYSEWAYDSARRPGDITLVEYAGGSSESYNYLSLIHI